MRWTVEAHEKRGPSAPSRHSPRMCRDVPRRSGHVVGLRGLFRDLAADFPALVGFGVDVEIKLSG